MSCKGLGIASLDISKKAGAADAIDTIRNAIDKVCEQRGVLGALGTALRSGSSACKHSSRIASSFFTIMPIERQSFSCPSRAFTRAFKPFTASFFRLFGNRETSCFPISKQS